MYSSKYLELLIEELSKLPSIGQKSAQRIAMRVQPRINCWIACQRTRQQKHPLQRGITGHH